MSTNILCPNCNKVASESYKKGFSDAMRLLREQLQLCQSIRPIEIKLPKNSVIIEPKIQSAKAKQQIKDSISELKTIVSDLENEIHQSCLDSSIENLNAVIAKLSPLI